MHTTLLGAAGLLLCLSCAPRPSTTASTSDATNEPHGAVLRAPKNTPTPHSEATIESRAGERPNVPDPATCALPDEIREPDWPRTLAPTVLGAPPLPQPGTRTLAVLPDTQYYASCQNDHLKKQTAWVASQLQARNILGVVQLGDLTEHNTEEEWVWVKDAFSVLAPKVPLFVASGNHDYGKEGSSDRRHSLFKKFFGVPAALTQAVTKTTLEPNNVENAYYRLPFGNITIGILVLEWSPRKATVAWAREVLHSHLKDRVLFVTHAYLFHDGSRYDYAKRGDEQPWNPRSYGTARANPDDPNGKDNWHPEGAYDGEMLWNELLKDHPGVFLTLHGHVLGDGAGLLTSRGTHGNAVHQVLANYQMLDEGGLGYLRLLEFDATGDGLIMHTYSPSLDRRATSKDQSFTLTLDPPLR